MFSSLVAAYLAVAPMNKRVDIITTSEVLAERDANEFTRFYQMFYLSVGHNCCKSNEEPNYGVHIVYGTANHFAGDLLRNEFYLKTNIRANRPYDAAIVDEVDSMFIDGRQHYTQLAILTPGYKALNNILRLIFLIFQTYNITEDNKFIMHDGNRYVTSKGVSFDYHLILI